ncbi:glycoside hydrolase family 99 protein [Amycolatopsis sp. 195334CR]|uniref:glycoside hydrolase family 99 protein n=1 Tax=Amycolatopsis sp. 195334CR TaxID=2814588 RepID=UPI001A8FDF18|nr:glycoside hydrolase family 99 protein [Amycolatopsis sp. 195334CR]MBN6037173.1 alpha-mannosidase [Amycolatopsis sp. 195334CR]
MRILLAVIMALAVLTTPAAAEPVALSEKTHIFYYPWYGNPEGHGSYRHWPQGGHQPPQDIGADFYPSLGPYDSGDFAGAVDQHMAWIQRAGVGTLVYSWWGRGSYEDGLVEGVLAAAAKYGLKVAWHLEPYGGRTAQSTVDDIAYINQRYGSSPAFYRDAAHGNRPAFYVFDSLSVADWSPIGPLRANNIVLAQTTDLSRVTHFGGIYTYDVLATMNPVGWRGIADYARANGLVWAPSIGPGYVDDRAVPGNTTPTLARDNGKTYDTQWSTVLDPANGGEPDWVSITSFNEWHEGSTLEPASSAPPSGHGYQTYDGAYGQTGAAAETAYLDRTAHWTAQF